MNNVGKEKKPEVCVKPDESSSLLDSQYFQAGGGGSALGPSEKERQITYPPRDSVEEASFESFPASDPPAW